MITFPLWQIAGWTMLHYFWVGAVLGTAALAVRPKLRSASASVRYLFALGSLLLLGVAPAVIAVVVMQNLAPAAHSVPPPVDSASQSAAGHPAEGRSTLAAGSPASTMATNLPAQSPEMRGPGRLLAALNLAVTCLPWFWVSGAPLCFLLTTAGLLGAERLRRQSRPLEDARTTEICRQLAASLKISYRVGVAVCDRIAVPILVGVLRPMILLPPAALAGWDPQQLEMVLLHELAHVRRYDNLVNLLQRIVESLLFFQPLVWIISGWVRREREHCCDELVVARTGQPQAYAEMLANLSETLSRRPLRSSSRVHPQVVSSMAERPLIARIRRVLKQEEQTMQISRKAVGLVFAALLAMAATIGGYYSLPSRAEDSPAQTKEPAAETARETKSSVPGDVIEGLIVDERGEPQPGMDVWTADRRGRKSSARSGAEGRFRLEVAEPLISEFGLLASTAEGTRQGILIAKKVGPSKLPLQKVVLKASRTVDIQVVDAGGTPVVGAMVESRVLGGACYVALEPVATDARGRARLMVPADARLEAIAALKAGAGMGYVCYLMDPAQGQSPPETARLVLNRAMSIGVRVQDSQGKPVAQVKVAPSDFRRKGKDDLTNYYSFHTLRAGAVSDAQGRVQFDWLPADLDRISFSVQHEDYYASGTGLTIKDGGSRNLDVKLLRLAQIAGKVIYSDGKAAAGIMIQAEGMGTGMSGCYARTAEDGTYRLKVPPNNSYIVAVADDQWAAASLTGIVLREGENRQNLDFQLSQGTLIHGTIRVDTESWRSVKTDRGLSVHDLMDDSFGDLMNDPSLLQFGPEIPDEWRSSPALFWADDSPDGYRVRLNRMTNVDATGHYAFRVGPGEYKLHVPGLPPKMERLIVTNQREIVVDSEFPKLPPPLRGIVVDRTGKPVPLAFVRYVIGAGSQLYAVAGQDGRFTLGRYERWAGQVYAGSPDAHLAGLQAVAVDQDDVTVVTDEAATVVGRLVDAAGRPLSGMTVRARFVPPQTPQLWIEVYAETDQEGKYKWSALVPRWQGKMHCYRFPDAEHDLEFFEGPKIVVQSGENNLGDTIPQPLDPVTNAPAAERN